MGWHIIIFLLAAWIVGVIAGVGGYWIHLVLVAALVGVAFQLAPERRSIV